MKMHTLMSGALLMMSWCSVSAIPVPSADQSEYCEVVAVENRPIFKKLDQDRKNMAIALRQTRCDAVNSGRIAVDEANTRIKEFLFREYYCVGKDIAPEQMKSILGRKDYLPDTLINAATKYCRDTFDSRRYLGVRWNVLSDANHWMRIECFCQRTRYMTEPDSRLSAFFHETGSPSLKRLHEQSLSLCAALRDGRMKYGDANYYWKQEVAWYERQRGPEAASELSTELEKTIGLFELLAK